MLVFAPLGGACNIGRPSALQGSKLARSEDPLPMPPVEAGLGQDTRGGTGAPISSAFAVVNLNDQALQCRLGKALDRTAVDDGIQGPDLARVQLLARALATGRGLQKGAQRRRLRLLELLENRIHL